VKYSFEVWAPDPRMYGQVHEYAAGEAAVQYGNFPARPRLLVGAGSGGYTITGPGGKRVVTNQYAITDAHYIDFASGGVFFSSGVRSSGDLTVYQPWEVPPGLPGVKATISGSRSLKVQVSDTFV
jgi:hypothetical protein